MSFWPWRSRPVVTPFSDDYSGRLIVYDNLIASLAIHVTIPDNIYIVPTSICYEIVCVAGLRPVDNTCISFYRGSDLIAASNLAGLTSLHTLRYTITANVTPSAPAGSGLCRVYPLPYPLFLYPNDLIVLGLNAFIAGDTLNFLNIHGQTWEVH